MNIKVMVLLAVSETYFVSLKDASYNFYFESAYKCVFIKIMISGFSNYSSEIWLLFNCFFYGNLLVAFASSYGICDC